MSRKAAKGEGKPCAYCGLKMVSSQARGDIRQATRDHIIPRSQGGSLKRSNRVHCCARCNFHKADMSLEDWLTLLRKHKDPRVGCVERVLAVWQRRHGPAIRSSNKPSWLNDIDHQEQEHGDV